MFTKAGLRAIDIMTTEMITIDAQASIQEAAALLIDNGISGVPVNDEFGRIIGLISLRDIGRFEREKPLLAGSTAPARNGPEPRPSRAGKQSRVPHGYHLEPQDEALVIQFMTPIVISLPQEAPLQAVIQTMKERKVHRVLVNDAEGKIVGIISALDVLRVIGDGA